jgi:hypothetical protein
MSKRHAKKEHTDPLLRQARDESLVRTYTIRQRLFLLSAVVAAVLGGLVLGRWDKGAVDVWEGVALILLIAAVSSGLFIYLAAASTRLQVSPESRGETPG